MPTFYETAVAEFQNEVTCEEYAAAWLLYQNRFGRLKNKNFKTVLCIALAILSGCYLPTYMAQYDSFWIPVIVTLVGLAGAVLFQVVFPSMEEKRGVSHYQSNQFLSAPAKAELFRDSYVLTNGCETLVGHWTDTLGCTETGALYVVMGGWDRTLLVIPKRVLTEEQKQAVSEHFRNTYVGKYRLSRG